MLVLLSLPVLSLGRSRAIAKQTGFRGFLWVGSSRWEEVTLFHCKSCAFIRSKPHYCQTHWFQTYHVGKRWLSFIARAVLSVGRSRTIAKQTGFICFFVELPSIGHLIIQQLHQHCLIFPHPPRKYNILLQCDSFKTPKLEKKRIPQMIDF